MSNARLLHTLPDYSIQIRSPFVGSLTGRNVLLAPFFGVTYKAPDRSMSWFISSHPPLQPARLFLHFLTPEANMLSRGHGKSIPAETRLKRQLSTVPHDLELLEQGREEFVQRAQRVSTQLNESLRMARDWS